jgi:hypothetical protein
MPELRSDPKGMMAMISRTRFCALGFALAMGGLLSAADLPEGGVGLLTRVPDLTPSLTKEEVEQDFKPWADRVGLVTAGWGMHQLIDFSQAHRVLSPKIPKVTKMVLYSLVPAEGEWVQKLYPERAAAFGVLPKFHGYPVLGTVAIEADGEAVRWGDFLRSQIIPGAFFACDFRPRHGLRFVLPDGEIDMLICFECSGLAIYGAVAPQSKVNPFPSPVVESLMNRLLDKHKVERDDPKKKKAAAAATEE